MGDWRIRFYHSLPYFGRMLVASARGFYLQRWRYGKETEQLVDQAHDRETWSAAQWKTWQEERLAFLLQRAATRVPFYREYWSKQRIAGSRLSSEYLENWPLLEKEELRRNPRAFVADDCITSRMFREHTSGTSGTPLTLWFSKRAIRRWFALLEARCRRWHGVSRHERWGVLGGQLVVLSSRRTPPVWVWNMGQRQLYLSSYHLGSDFAEAYLDALRSHSIKYLLGYPSALNTLAAFAVRHGLKETQLKVVISNAEPLHDYQRRNIVQGFGCPVRDTYGMAEVALAGSECEKGSMHVWPEVGIMEQIPEQSVGSYEMAATGLLNADMPLIRYRTGDRIVPPKGKPTCSCGRTLPLLGTIEGRNDDMLVTPNGRLIGRLDSVFKDGIPIREAQIIQDNLRRVKLLYVPSAEYTMAADDVLIQRVRDRMGEVEVVLESVNEIPRGANGKFRAVICNLLPEECARAR